MAYPVDIRSFGAKGDGVTNDSPAFAAAIVSGQTTIAVTPGDYKISGVTVDRPMRFRGMGGSFWKGGNGPAFIIASPEVKFFDITLHGVGATYTGVGIEVHDGDDFRWAEGDIVDTESYCIDFTEAVGGARATVRDCLVLVRGAALEAIRLPLLEANGDRSIQNVCCAGGKLIDFAGCSTTLVSGCNTTGMKFSADSKKVSIVNTRFAGPILVMHGRDHALSGNIMANTIVLDTDCRDSSVVGNRITGGAITNSGINNTISPNAIT